MLHQGVAMFHRSMCLAVAIVASAGARGVAADQPLNAARLRFVENSTGATGKGLWISKVPQVALPASDPRTVGGTLRITGLDQEIVFLLASEFWTLDVAGTRFKFKDTTRGPGRPAPVKKMEMTAGKGLKLVAKSERVDLDDAAPDEVSILLTIGSDVYCSTCSALQSGAAGYLAKDCSAPPVCPTPAPLPCGTFLTKWGEIGTAAGEFDYMYGVATSPTGHVYVVDRQNRRVQKFGSSGNFLSQWGTEGTADGQFQLPTDAAVDASGNVYVLDVGTNRVQKFTANGVFLAKWGSLGSGPGEFLSPYGIATDGAGNVYVADTLNHRIQKFDAGGGFLLEWGGYGSADGEFDYPYDVAADGSGNIYVADYENYRIQKFDAAGAFVTKWGDQGSWAGQFDSPYSIATDEAGDVYVVDLYSDRVQKFTGDGTFLALFGGTGSADGKLTLPLGIATAPGRKVYVADRGNERIQIFLCQ
jgi:sugar lactone lactonase YvrE